MNKVTVVVVLILIISWAALERKAAYCGESWFSPELPHNLEPEYFNGLFLFKYGEWDSDFAVGPFYKVNEMNGVIDVQAIYGYPTKDAIGHYVRIQSYSINKDVFTELVSWDQSASVIHEDDKKYYFVIDGHYKQGSSEQDVKVFDHETFERYTGKRVTELQWISVGISSYFLLALFVLRFTLLVAITYILWALWGSRKLHA